MQTAIRDLHFDHPHHRTNGTYDGLKETIWALAKCGWEIWAESRND